MDHKTFLGSLLPSQREALTAKTNGAGLTRLATHAGAILALGAYVQLAGPAWPLALLPLGILLAFLFTLLHEVSHDTVFTHRRLNRAVAMLSGATIFLGATWFRFFHFAHHRHTHDPDHDPELASPKPTTQAGYAWHVSGIPLWISTIKTLIANATTGEIGPYIPAAKHATVRTEARALIALYILLACLFPALLWLWIIPILIGQPFLRLYLLAEHTGCPHEEDMFSNTRTTFTTHLVRWFAWNMPYHAEHHTFPTVPFHQLPALHTLTRDHLRQTENGYTAFNANYLRRINAATAK